MIFDEIHNQKSNLTVTNLCKLSGVSKSGYYAWKARKDKPDTKEQRDLEDFKLILKAVEARGYDKGVEGIRMRLFRMGVRMNHKKIRRLMKKFNLVCPIRRANPYRRMAKAMQTNAVADNLVKREFKKHGPRKVLLTDITYIPYNGKFCYLSTIKDAYTNEILAYRMSDNLGVEFVLDTINDLIENHGASLDSTTMIHSDQGSHYTSISFRKLLNDNELVQSMSRRGNCWDNAPQESFFGHMKQELLKYQSGWKSFEDVKKRIDDWMDYYNNERYQKNLLMMAPSEYYIYCTTGKYPESLLWAV